MVHAARDWNPLEAMPAGHDFEVYHLWDRQGGRGILHSHAYYEFYFFLGGQAQIMVEGRDYTARPGELFLFPPGFMHRSLVTAGEDCPYERAYLYLTENMLQSMDSPSCSLSEIVHGAAQAGRLHCRPDPEFCASLIRRMDRIIETENSGNPIDTCINRGRLMILTASLCAAIQEERYREEMQEDSVAAQVMAYIHAHLTEDLTLEVLAEKLYVSKYHMLHAFREKTGTSVHQYILMKRVVYAQMLMENGFSPAQAARESGFKDYACFYRAFRSRTEHTPQEYASLTGQMD